MAMFISSIWCAIVFHFGGFTNLERAIPLVGASAAAASGHTRDKALLLLGFWRGFRGDELTRLHVEHVDAIRGEGMTCFLPRTKGDRAHNGTAFKAPALARLCAVDAYIAWVELAGLTGGPVFRGINRWGRLAPKGCTLIVWSRCCARDRGA